MLKLFVRFLCIYYLLAISKDGIASPINSDSLRAGPLTYWGFSFSTSICSPLIIQREFGPMELKSFPFLGFGLSYDKYWNLKNGKSILLSLKTGIIPFTQFARMHKAQTQANPLVDDIRSIDYGPMFFSLPVLFEKK
jgi:hypothetical protein